MRPEKPGSWERQTARSQRGPPALGVLDGSWGGTCEDGHTQGAGERPRRARGATAAGAPGTLRRRAG